MSVWIKAALLLACAPALASAQPSALKFDFGSDRVAPGYTHVLPTTIYTKKLGYGFDLGSRVTAVDRGGDDPLRSDFCTSSQPFYFSVALAEGNYNVTVILGDLSGETATSIKAESRRLMLENVKTAKGQFATRAFTVNVRTPKIAGDRQVRLKPRERGPPLVPDWDDKLMLEFNGARPCVCAVEITKADDAITLFLAGDSTVTDQPNEPWNSWGQMLPRFFKPRVAVANHAESGESLKSFLDAKRLEKIFSAMKAGDYLFIQFGHNDQKDRARNAGAFTSYKTNLMRYIAEARKRGGLPAVLTPMERKAGVSNDTLGEFPAAARAAAKEANVPLIDLHSMSKVLYAALGPNLDKAFQDGTHHNNYGSYELARCVVAGIKENKLAIARFLVDDIGPFDPAHPDSIESFSVPASPMKSSVKPEGN